MPNRAVLLAVGRPEATHIAPFVALGAAVVGLAVLSRPGLGRPSIWLDEAVSVYSARTDWWPPLDALRTDAVRYMSFYYLLLSAWTSLGNSEAILRSLSVLFAVASLPVVFVLGRRYFGDFVGATSAVLLAANALLDDYAREARGYTLLVFLAASSMLLFAYAVERRSRAAWVAWAVVTAVAAYVHWYVAYVVAAQLLALAFLPSLKSRVVGALGALLLLGALVVPLAYVVASSGVAGMSWIRAPVIQDVPAMFIAIAGATGVVSLGYLVAGVVGSIGCRPVVPVLHRWPVVLVTAWAGLPLIGSFVVSQAVPMFLDRYMIISTPAIAMLAAMGLASLRSRGVALALAGVLLIGSTVSAVSTVQAIRHEDWRSATRYVLRETLPDDGIVFYAGFIRQPFEYYVERLGLTPPAPLYPSGPWGMSKPLLGSQSLAPAEAVIESRKHARIWLVLSHAPDSAVRRTLFAELDANYRLVSQKAFAVWVFVRLYERAPLSTDLTGPPGWS